MRIAVPKETKLKENRVALSPDVVKELVKKGFTDVAIEKGAGVNSYFNDDLYTAAGATIVNDRKELFATADVLLSVNAPSAQDIGNMKKDSILLSFMYAQTHPELVDACVKAGVSAFSVDAIPRIS
ncbi:MAG TPA: NAD(P)(+) transhydrogenase (Re/Si-specific) subunit alpha, partial [Bacteroidia bacterium]|nr:NAD(P)(+) transhydrogenase (Re/Si-specific) subunit alpha [Bacteroidia bacterium]